VLLVIFGERAVRFGVLGINFEHVLEPGHAFLWFAVAEKSLAILHPRPRSYGVLLHLFGKFMQAQAIGLDGPYLDLTFAGLAGGILRKSEDPPNGAVHLSGCGLSSFSPV
jgi:hypothetical protein